MGTAIYAPITAASAVLLLGACDGSLEQRETAEAPQAPRAEAAASDLHHLPQRYAQAEDGRFNQHIKAGFEAEERGDPEAAVAEYTQAILLKPQDPGAYYNRGNVYRRLGQQQSAVEDYDEAIRLEPRFARLYLSRGGAYHNLGEFQGAVQDFDGAIGLNPELVEVYVNRGFAYMGLGQPERAIEDATAAIKLDPFLAEAYLNRGSAYMALGQPQQAIEDATSVIWLNPGLRDPGAVVPPRVLARAHLNRGLAYQDLGQPRAGRTGLRRGNSYRSAAWPGLRGEGAELRRAVQGRQGPTGRRPGERAGIGHPSTGGGDRGPAE